MKLKKKAKKVLVGFLVILVIVLGVLAFKDKLFGNKEDVKEVKVVNKIEKYGYTLKENKPKEYKKMFEELKKILEAKEVDEEAYAKKLSEMFIYDFYSLKDKTAKTDIGGVEFVYGDFLPNFLQNAQNTYYKYVENNIYGNRNQSLPVVSNIEVVSVEKQAFAYGDKTDEEAYKVNVKWSYTESEFSSYQKEADIILIHDDIKLSLVELQ